MHVQKSTNDMIIAFELLLGSRALTGFVNLEDG